MWILAAFGLLILGLVLIVVDFILPSGGLITAGGGFAILAAMYLGYSAWGGWGLALFVVLSVVTVPMAIMYGLSKLTLKATLSKDQGYVSTSDMNFLLGKLGLAATDLRPAGRMEIEGEFYDVVSEQTVIKKGSQVKVLLVEGNRVVVGEVADANIDQGAKA